MLGQEDDGRGQSNGKGSLGLESLRGVGVAVGSEGRAPARSGGAVTWAFKESGVRAESSPSSLSFS
jgi:hypothetical protein